MKLVHISGYVGCHPTARSYWGCASTSGDPVSKPIEIIMIITDVNDQVFYPSPRLVEIGINGHSGWYTLPGYTSSSADLVFTDFGYPKFFKSGDKLKVWYGEDLYGYTEDDNHGSTCMDVYAYIMPQL